MAPIGTVMGAAVASDAVLILAGLEKYVAPPKLTIVLYCCSMTHALSTACPGGSYSSRLESTWSRSHSHPFALAHCSISR